MPPVGMIQETACVMVRRECEGKEVTRRIV